MASKEAIAVSDIPKVEQWQAVQCRRCGALLVTKRASQQLNINRIHVVDVRVTWSGVEATVRIRCRHCDRITIVRQRRLWLTCEAECDKMPIAT